jgi:CubicO group peptidase (beta-lactamase class C family)
MDNAADGALGLDDPVLAHLPELADTAAAGSEMITVRHLLRMTAGNGYRWAYEDADHPGDPAREFLAAPLVAEPGSTYLRDFLVPRLFDPLGIRNPQWLRCPLGRTYGLHVWLCARDGAWRMDGIYGQFGIVLPQHHACVSIMAHYLGPTTHILDCAWEHIVPALA